MTPVENILKLKNKIALKEKEKKDKPKALTKEDVSLLIMTALLLISALCVFFDYMSPFWYPLISYIFFSQGEKGKYASFSIVLFLFTSGLSSFVRSGIYIISLFGLNMTGGIKNNKLIWAVSSMFLCLFSGIAVTLIFKLSFIRGVYFVAESVITIGMFYVYSIGFPAVFNYKNKCVFSNEEVICINLIISVIISAFARFEILGINLSNVLAVCSILICAHYFDLSSAMVQAISSGLFISLALSGNFYIISILSAASLFACLIDRYSAVGSVVAFIICALSMSLYLYRKIYFVPTPLEMIIGGAIYLLFVFIVGDEVIQKRKDEAKKQTVFDEAVKKVVKEQILTQKGMLKEISNNMSIKKEFSREDFRDTMLRIITSDICSGCNMYSNCWKDDAQKTYSNFLDVMDLYMDDPSVSYNMLPKGFISTCNKGFIMFKVISYLSDFQRLKNNYILKLNKFKELIALQFTHISRVLDLTYEQIEKGIATDTEDSLRVAAALEREGIGIEKVVVMNDFNSSLKVFLRPRERLNREYLRKNVSDVISDILQKSISYEYTLKPYAKDALFEYVFCEDTTYSLVTGVKKCTKNDGINSGDNYSDVMLLNNNHLIALCDGMGSGKKASSQSSRVLNMLEDLLNGNTEEMLAIKTINSLLVLEDEEEVFSTLDMMLFDLNTAQATFIKAGAVSSYIKRNRQIIKIQKDCLPIGIIEDVNMKKQTYELQDGDMIIFMSDGYLSAINNNEEYLVEKLSSSTTKNPQRLADELFNEAVNICDNDIKDDITILVSKVKGD